MSENLESTDIQEESKINFYNNANDNEGEIPDQKPISKQQDIFYNQIHITKGQKNVYVNNLKGIKSVELKHQVQAHHFDDAFCLCILDNIYLAIGSTDATITIYNLKNNCKLVRKINYFSEPILVLEPLRLFHKTLLLSSGYDQIINVWDYLSGKKIIGLESCGSELTKLCDNLDRNLIVGSTQDGRIIVWSYTSQRIVNVLKLESQIHKEQRQKIIQNLIEIEQTQNLDQEEEEGEYDDIAFDSEMDLESHGSIYSLQQICSDQYLVLQRGCISEIRIIKHFEEPEVDHQNANQNNNNNNKNSSTSDIQTEEDQEYDPNFKYHRRGSHVKKIRSIQLQVIRQFEANQDAIQFNLVPYENQKIITLGTKRGFIYLYDYENGTSFANNQTLTGSVNEILTIQTADKKCDNPFIISTSHSDRCLKIESLKTAEVIVVRDDRIFCYNECMNSKMQFFKNKKNELFIAVICQEHQNPYFSVFQIHMDFHEISSIQNQSSSSSSSFNLPSPQEQQQQQQQQQQNTKTQTLS